MENAEKVTLTEALLTQRLLLMEERINNSVSLKVYVDAQMNALEEARKLAHDNLQIRLESMNEFRAQLVVTLRQFYLHYH